MNPGIERGADGVVGVAAVTSPWWFVTFETGAHGYILAGGMLLITLRVLAAWRDWRRRDGNR